MAKLIKSVEANIINLVTNDVKFVNSVSAEMQREDYIGFASFKAYLQDLTKAESTSSLTTPLTFGLKNRYNSKVISLNVSK